MRFLLFVAVVALAGCAESAQPLATEISCEDGAGKQRMAIAGHVFDHENRPLEGALVKVDVITATAAGDGSWSIDGLAEGCKYSLDASSDGCESYKGTVKAETNRQLILLNCM